MNPGGRHSSGNVRCGPMWIIEIELKKPAPAVAPVRKPELDPLRLDPRHNILLLELTTRCGCFGVGASSAAANQWTNM